MGVDIVEGTIVRNRDIPFYCSPERMELVSEAITLWHRTKKWGLANGAIGWANEPKGYIEAISIIESENDNLEREQMKKQREAMQAPAKNGGKGK